MSGIKKKKTKEYIVTCRFVDCPDAEERTQKICELILKANINKLKRCQKKDLKEEDGGRLE